MKKKYYLIPVLGFCLLLVVTGCDIQLGNWGRAKYERTVQKQFPLDTGSTVIAQTSSGSITVTGADVTDCNVVAEIRVRALTEEEAKETAEQVEIILEQVGNTLTVKAKKPLIKKLKRSITISYDITVPRKTNVECASSYGPVKLSNILGSAKGKSSSGSISAEDIQGSVHLDTSYGSVTCVNVSGDNIKAKSSSGSIKAQNIKGSVDLDTSYGSITCEDISGGDLKLRTSSGKIKLSKASCGDFNLHTSYGSIRAEELTGKVLKLHSGSGGIDVTQASADSADISTSYGRITCRKLTTADLTAKSGSGNINIACSDSTSPEIRANVVTSYGSVDFEAPPDFAGSVDMATSYGSISTDLPITISGEISKKKLAGTIGQGNGKLYLKTSSGSIKIRWPDKQEVN
ncbi:MAG: DUF4097 family beta strand repeat protein [Planctomycetes bacterium]|nr:DUF4097 family beta strand repeat protein [Planctomycetota bacterium]MBL7145625.1 DUF4097 family beta strand repeat protein [Phycisphaerae bacterium]